jgi:hypothetical protein
MRTKTFVLKLVGTNSEFDETPSTSLVHNLAATAQPGDLSVIFTSHHNLGEVIDPDGGFPGYQRFRAQVGEDDNRVEGWYAVLTGGETSATIAAWVEKGAAKFVISALFRDADPTIGAIGGSGSEVVSPHQINVSRTDGSITIIHHCVSWVGNEALTGPSVSGYTQGSYLDGNTLADSMDCGVWTKQQTANSPQLTNWSWDDGAQIGSSILITLVINPFIPGDS